MTRAPFDTPLRTQTLSRWKPWRLCLARCGRARRQVLLRGPRRGLGLEYPPPPTQLLTVQRWRSIGTRAVSFRHAVCSKAEIVDRPFGPVRQGEGPVRQGWGDGWPGKGGGVGVRGRQRWGLTVRVFGRCSRKVMMGVRRLIGWVKVAVCKSSEILRLICVPKLADVAAVSFEPLPAPACAVEKRRRGQRRSSVACRD